MKLKVSKCGFVATYPIKLDILSRVKRGIFTDGVCNIPRENGEHIDLTSLLLKYQAEELVMLCGIRKNRFVLENEEENYRVIMEADLDCFLNCTL